MGIFYQDNAVLESESIFKLSYRTPVVLKAKKGKRSELREIALREAAASMR